MTIVVRRQRLFDGMAIGASTLCLVHCLAIPVLLILVPALSGFFAFPEEFHLWVLVVAIVTSGMAVYLGYQRHHHVLPGVMAVLGLVTLAAAEAYHGTPVETWLAVTGSLVLAVAHLVNLRLVRRRG